jgi:thioredoxin-dependent peroxiredoxin
MDLRRTGVTTAGGEPVTLLGPALEAGRPAPGFVCVTADAEGVPSEVRLADTPDRVRLFSIVPSVDTSVCSLQARRFDEEVRAFGDAVQLYAVSVDTPYRLTGFAQEHGLDRTTGLSDYRPERSLGRAWGLLVEEDQELCRACVVLDPRGTVAYVQIAPDTWEHVDYDDVLAQLRRAVDAG